MGIVRTPCAPVLSVPLSENAGALMHDNVGHFCQVRTNR